MGSTRVLNRKTLLLRLLIRETTADGELRYRHPPSKTGVSSADKRPIQLLKITSCCRSVSFGSICTTSGVSGTSTEYFCGPLSFSMGDRSAACEFYWPLCLIERGRRQAAEHSMTIFVNVVLHTKNTDPDLSTRSLT